MKISNEYVKQIRKEDYKQRKTIKDVVVRDIKQIIGEDGSFSELARFSSEGFFNEFSQFKILQINRSILLPGGIKAWHLHFNQEDIWYVTPESHLLIGLLDLRKGSPSLNISMRFVMGAGKSQILYIPRGVAHGMANLTPDKAEVIYFVNQYFNAENSDENRLPWDFLGREFWQMSKG